VSTNIASARPSAAPGDHTSGGWADRHPSIPYVGPFVLFLVLLMTAEYLRPLGAWEYPLRVIILSAALILLSRHVIDLRVRSFVPSVAVGVAVFGIWIAPDLLFPGYRDSILFSNPITGTLKSSVDEVLRSDPMVLVFRTVRAVLLVPIIEELFWRGWLMRWLINPDFRQVPLGAYTAQAMIVSAALFASEHGPYWDVGLIAGLIYNWWMIRTKSLGDCILAHAVTNGVLSAYVIATGAWQYWM
jgi:CAAX prenyl protease-like protein